MFFTSPLFSCVQNRQKNQMNFGLYTQNKLLSLGEKQNLRLTKNFKGV